MSVQTHTDKVEASLNGHWYNAVAALAPTTWYRMTERSGSAFADSGSLAGGATKTGSGSFTFGDPGLVPTGGGVSLRFPGNGGGAPAYLASNAIIALTATGSFTIEVWFKTSTGAQMPFVSNRNGTPAGNMYFGLTSSGHVFFFFDEDPAIVDSGATNYADGLPHQAVISRTGSTTSLYVDGAVKASRFGAVSTSSKTLNVGFDSPNTEYFTGNLDEVVIYNGTALTAAQIATNHSYGLWTDITTDVVLADGMSIQHGCWRQGIEAIIADPAEFRFVLNNSTGNSAQTLGYYSPWSAFKRPGFGFGVLIRHMITTQAGLLFTAFLGRITDINPEPGTKLGRKVPCVAHCPLFQHEQMPIKEAIQVQSNKTADQALDTLLSTLDPDYKVIYTSNFSVGNSRLAYVFDGITYGQTSVYEEETTIVGSERGFLFFSPMDASLTFKNSSDDSTIVSQNDFTDSDLIDLKVPSVVDDQPTRLEVDVAPATFAGSGGSPIVIATVGDTQQAIAPGQTIILTAKINNTSTSPPEGTQLAGYAIIAPVAATDYNFNTSPDGGGTGLNGSFAVVATLAADAVKFAITNNDTSSRSGYIVAPLQARGTIIYRNPMTMFNENDYDKTANRVVKFSMKYQNAFRIGQYLADFYAYVYANPVVPRASEGKYLANASAAASLQAGTRQIYDRITISETVNGYVQVEFQIWGIRHEIMGNRTWWTTYALEIQELAKWIDTIGFDLTSGSGSMSWGNTIPPTVLQPTIAYYRENTLMTVSFDIPSSAVGGTLSSALRIAVPLGKSIVGYTVSQVQLIDAGVAVNGFAIATASVPGFIQIVRQDGANFSTTNGGTIVRGQITFRTN